MRHEYNINIGLQPATCNTRAQNKWRECVTPTPNNILEPWHETAVLG